MGNFGQGYTGIYADLEDGHPKHLEIKREIDLEDDGSIASDWYVLGLDFSPTTSLHLIAESLDQLEALALKLTQAINARRLQDIRAAVRGAR
jgi:hypothetical protein